MKIESWIIRNLGDFGNCLIPKKLVTEYGLNKLSLMLSNEIGRMVVVEKKESAFVTDANHSHTVDFSRRKNQKGFKEYIYVARLMDWS